MPIYRGGQKRKPVRDGQELSRVYRGEDLVWQNSLSYPFTGAWTVTPAQPWTHTFTTPGLYLVTLEEVTGTLGVTASMAGELAAEGILGGVNQGGDSYFMITAVRVRAGDTITLIPMGTSGTASGTIAIEDVSHLDPGLQTRNLGGLAQTLPTGNVWTEIIGTTLPYVMRAQVSGSANWFNDSTRTKTIRLFGAAEADGIGTPGRTVTFDGWTSVTELRGTDNGDVVLQLQGRVDSATSSVRRILSSELVVTEYL